MDENERSSSTYPKSFSKALIHHCECGFVPPSVFTDISQSLPQFKRFVRFHPLFIAEAEKVSIKENISVIKICIKNLSEALNVSDQFVSYVDWLPGFYVFSVPRTIKVSNLKLFRDGVIIPMDAASVAAVVALAPEPGDLMLDLCCAPAMKLSLLAERVKTPDLTQGLAVGVDLNVDRLYVARSLLVKHNRYATKHKECEDQNAAAKHSCLPVTLFLADGCEFMLGKGFDALDKDGRATVGVKGLTAKEERNLSKRPRLSQTGCDKGSIVLPVYVPSKARESLNRLVNTDSRSLFDKVLVDAECTHDGSIAHLDLENGNTLPTNTLMSSDDLQKNENVCGGITNARRTAKINVDSAESVKDGDVSENCIYPAQEDETALKIPDLQLRLLENGYAQLKPNGVLVYCTCSFSFSQNEGVLLRFLAKQKDESNNERCAPVVLPAFEFTETKFKGTEDKELFHSLQERLNATSRNYETVQKGIRSLCKNDEEIKELEDKLEKGLLGSRFWPLTFDTSFQYIVKIWKQAKEE